MPRLKLSRFLVSVLKVGQTIAFCRLSSLTMVCPTEVPCHA
jgi:hypothetical protein